MVHISSPLSTHERDGVQPGALALARYGECGSMTTHRLHRDSQNRSIGAAGIGADRTGMSPARVLTG
jgi:hypothetical protein